MCKIRSVSVCICIVLSLSVCLERNAQAELGPQLKIGDQVLVLNGAGGRTKAFVQIYESGLYLQRPSSDARAILEADELMAIRVKITSSLVSRASLLSSLQEGLAQSTGGQPESIAQETNQLMQMLKEEVKKNDYFDFVNIPNRGLYVLKNGAVQGVIPGLAFKKALFGVWLSDSPVDSGLRQAMLSGGSKR